MSCYELDKIAACDAFIVVVHDDQTQNKCGGLPTFKKKYQLRKTASPSYPVTVNLYLCDSIPTANVEYLALPLAPENISRSTLSSYFILRVSVWRTSYPKRFLINFNYKQKGFFWKKTNSLNITKVIVIMKGFICFNIICITVYKICWKPNPFIDVLKTDWSHVEYLAIFNLQIYNHTVSFVVKQLETLHMQYTFLQNVWFSFLINMCNNIFDNKERFGKKFHMYYMICELPH